MRLLDPGSGAQQRACGSGIGGWRVGKDAYWFRHDSNAAHDPKMMRLTAKYGCAGYGAFWRVVEYMRDQDGGALHEGDIEVLAVELREPALPQIIEDCCAWKLFERVDGSIQSKRLCREIKSYQHMRVRDTKRMQQWRERDGAVTRHTAVTDASLARHEQREDREDRQTERTEQTEKDPTYERKQELGDRGAEGKGGSYPQAPPTAASAGSCRPAGRPGKSEPEPDAAQEPADSAIPLHELPPLLRTATARARAKIDADARRKAEHLAQKTSDYHAVKQPVNGVPYAARGAPPEPDEFPPLKQAANSESADDFVDAGEAT